MNFQEYRKHDATALAELIKKKEVTPQELLDIAIKRAEEVNPKINAVVNKLYDLGKEQIKTLDPNATFSGVPFLLKDLGPELKGTIYTAGTRYLKNYVSPQNSVVTDRILKSGLVIFGKTNIPEFGLTPFTESELHGPAHNPWNLNRTTGGSSGGSAAAVAAGIVPMASANDGGGSIRIPASCNGLVGLKPSRGRITMGPQFGEAWNGATHEGVVTRSVRDSALYYDLMSGGSPGDPYTIQHPERPYTEEIKTPTGKLKIGYSVEFPQGFDFKKDEENIEAIKSTVQLLKDLGHEVEEVKMPFTKEMLMETFTILIYGELSASLTELEKIHGRKLSPKDFEPQTWLLYQLGKSYSAHDYALGRLSWNNISRIMGEFHQKYDIFLTPTLGEKPFIIGSKQSPKFEDAGLRFLHKMGISHLLRYTAKVEETAARTFQWIPIVPMFNMTGQPSITLPLHWSKDNLPIGTLFTAAMGNEGVLFRLAAQLEKAKPWFDMVPVI
jgi:amidase